ncbi:MAG TPA: alpha/beta hydrolase-fold protein [Phnomibacter sp.]|nr:alpha/beta hydrolase-fold protein [Phnomibacter sp.]
MAVKIINLIAGICFGLLGAMMNAQQTIAQPLPQVNEGSIQRLENFASAWVAPRHIDVWLPNGYTNAKKYAVLYMHDGQMLYDARTTWNNQAWEVHETLQRLMDSGQIKDCIVVGIWNSGPNRHSEYFPQKPFMALPQRYQDSLLENGSRSGGNALFAGPISSDNYLRFLVTELKPFIDKTFSTYPDAANTLVAGSSMGGLISMYALCEYPKVFGGAACLSTHWPGIFSVENNPIPAAFLGYLDAQLPSPANHRLYFDYGTATLDSLYEPYQLQANAIMQKHRYGPGNWLTMAFPGANHSEQAWQQRFEIPAYFLLRRQEPAPKQSEKSKARKTQPGGATQKRRHR